MAPQTAGLMHVARWVPAALLLAGCAAAPTVPERPWDDDAARLEQVRDWQAQGRLSATTDDDSVQGRFEWRQRPNWLEVRFRGPLGVGGLFVFGPPDRLTAIGRDGEQVVLGDPEADIRGLFGHALPVTSMPRWMLGLNDPDYGHRYRFDDNGLPLSLEQRNWTIDYTGWRRHAGYLLPRRIDMRRDGVAVRVVLDGWSPAAEGS